MYEAAEYSRTNNLAAQVQQEISIRRVDDVIEEKEERVGSPDIVSYNFPDPSAHNEIIQEVAKTKDFIIFTDQMEPFIPKTMTAMTDKFDVSPHSKNVDTKLLKTSHEK
ncbi:MAG: hypothetical protein KA998_03005 [Rickettsiaceae bacterium]|nr:hypothetical protein [Rickettsiaceae bacterium]